jgi:SAM-dependent methyltransferase
VARADATHLPLPDASVDAALVVHVFHLIPEWRRALAEIARVLGPGAALVHAESGVPILDAVTRRASRGSGFRVARVGAGERDRSLDEAGWRLDAEPASFSFPRPLVPAAMLRLIQERAFAWTFELSDAQLQTAVDAAREAMRERFSSLDEPVELEGVCRVERRRPPDA